MRVQDFLCLLLWMIEDFKVVRVSFNQSFSALGAFRRGTVLCFQVFLIYIAAWLLLVSPIIELHGFRSSLVSSHCC